METLRRILATEFRTVSEKDQPKKIRGYAAVFNVEADIGGVFVETIAPGAFARAIKENQDVRALVDHNPTLILGRTKAKTLHLSEDEKGLYIEITPPETQAGRDIVTSIERGDVDQMSFGFSIRSQEWKSGVDGQPPVRTIKDVDLYDVSPVTFPAYEATEAYVRSAQKEIQELKPTEAAPAVVEQKPEVKNEPFHDPAIYAALCDLAELI